MTAPLDPGRAYETSLSDDRRRRDGIHYTPPSIVTELVACAFVALGRAPRHAFDPACGGGAFLLGVLDALVASGVEPADALRRVRGSDIDTDALVVARRALVAWAIGHDLEPGSVPAEALRLADTLVVDWPGDVDLIVGNPPFGGQLRGPTVRDRGRTDRAAAILGRRPGYADTAGLFLLRAVDAVEPGGVVVLVQPMSVLAARDADGVRRWIDDRAAVRDIRIPDPSGFDASVRVCAPVLVRERGHHLFGDRAGASRAWSEIAADALGLPPAPSAGAQTLADLADVTAGFRDEFYAVARFVTEADADDDRPRLVTSGSIEPGRVLWGERPTTVLRRRFDRPVVDVDALQQWADGPDGDRRIAWSLARRRAPKVLVATQTRGIEAVVDPDGRLWPSVPVVSVLPRSVDVWVVLAALSSRQATTWMARRSIGTGLSAGALRISARVLAELPVPDDVGPWHEAADRLRAGAAVDDPAVLDAMSRAWHATTT